MTLFELEDWIRFWRIVLIDQKSSSKSAQFPLTMVPLLGHTCALRHDGRRPATSRRRGVLPWPLRQPAPRPFPHHHPHASRHAYDDADRELRGTLALPVGRSSTIRSNWGGYISFRPLRARARVTWSENSRSEPMGTPRAMRVTRKPGVLWRSRAM